MNAKTNKSKKPTTFDRRKSGFAVVLALALMGFLLTLLLGLMMLVRVETKVASQSLTMTQARQNALLGLNVALGELQKHAGPDTRATGPAELWDDPAAAPVTSLPAANVRHRNWTGVWDSSRPRVIDDASKTDGSVLYNPNLAAADSVNRKPLPLKWLVSGLATDGSDPSPDKSLEDPILMVASGSVIDPDQDGVDAGLVAPQGMGGAYAYWVSDESVKARYGVVEPEDLATAGVGTIAAESRVLSAQATGLGVMYSDDSDSQTWKDLGYAIDTAAGRSTLDRYNQLQMGPLDSNLSEPLKYRFHDISHSSEGLLTDPVEGGLKQDLTVYLQTGAGLTDSDPIIDAVRFPDIDTGGENMPKWGKLRDWTNTSTPLAVSIGDDENFNISPVITFAGFDVGLSLNGANLYAHIFPQIAIWNPYNTRLLAPDGYTVTFRIMGNNSYMQIKEVRDVPMDGSPAQDYGDDTWMSSGSSVTGYEIQVGDMLAASMSIPSPSYTDKTQRVFLRFYLDDNGSGVSLEPGEVVVYTLSNMENLSGNPLPMTRGRVEPFENNPSIRILAETLSPTPRDQLDFTYDRVYFDWADVRLFPGRVTDDPVGTDCLTRLFYSSWGNSSGDVAGSLDVTAGNAGVNLRDYQGRMSLRPFSYHASSVWPSFQPYSALRGFSQNNYRSRYIPRFPAGGTAYNSADIPGSAQTFTQEAGPMRFGDGEFDFPLSQSNPDNAFAPWATFGSDPDSASVDVARQTSYSPIFWQPRTPVQLLSLGNLQHAPLSSHVWQPSYPVGNSFADSFISRDHYSGLFDSTGVYYQDPSTSTDSNASYSAPDNAHLDVSYLLNASIWDRYFLSGFDAGAGRLQLSADQLSGDEALPNSRYRLIDGPTYGTGASADANGQFEAGASYLAVRGAFNINSTSVEAWKAVLASSLELPINGHTENDSVTLARMPNPGDGSGGFFDVETEDFPLAESPGAYNAARALGMNEIELLAQNIVEEVKLRGPFLSLSDFVNRRLIAADDDPEATGIRGALQAAIDRASESDGMINNRFIESGNSQTFLSNADLRPAQVVVEHALAGQAEYSTSAGVPGFLLQSDLLSALGSTLTSRGDTFVIRAYGQMQSEVTGNTVAEAWCEAVVQRQLEYVDESDQAWETPAPNSTNANFGRRFRVVSFRWLDRDEI